MAYQIWPAEFPQKPLAASTFDAWAQPASADTDHLLPVLRRRSSTDAVGWQVSWLFENGGASPTQWQLFLAWVRDYLGGGVLPFLWPVWDGVAFVNRITWFAGGVTASTQSGGLRITASAPLLILDPPKISKATLDAAVTISTGDPA